MEMMPTWERRGLWRMAVWEVVGMTTAPFFLVEEEGSRSAKMGRLGLGWVECKWADTAAEIKIKRKSKWAAEEELGWKKKDFWAELRMGIGVELGCWFLNPRKFSNFQSSFEFKQGNFKPTHAFGIFSTMKKFGIWFKDSNFKSRT
jgi:hypothetical protein